MIGLAPKPLALSLHTCSISRSSASLTLFIVLGDHTPAQ